MILDKIVEAKKIRLAASRQEVSEEEMKKQALACTRTSISFYDALKKDGLSIIGEFKNASPSHGTMDNKIDLTERISQYSKAVDAISVLTEEDFFLGSVAYLKQIRNMTALPIIRKDFIFTAYQVYEAKIIGADAILLIAAILDDRTFRKLYDLAYSLGMDVLCEVHNEKELERVLNLHVKIIGINNRNLNDFSVALATTERLTKCYSNQLQDEVIVSESGVSKDDDIRLLRRSNVDAFLIGTAFMEAPEPGKLADRWKEIYHDAN